MENRAHSNRVSVSKKTWFISTHLHWQRIFYQQNFYSRNFLFKIQNPNQPEDWAWCEIRRIFSRLWDFIRSPSIVSQDLQLEKAGEAPGWGITIGKGSSQVGYLVKYNQLAPNNQDMWMWIFDLVHWGKFYPFMHLIFKSLKSSLFRQKNMEHH